MAAIRLRVWQCKRCSRTFRERPDVCPGSGPLDPCGCKMFRRGLGPSPLPVPGDEPEEAAGDEPEDVPAQRTDPSSPGPGGSKGRPRLPQDGRSRPA